MSFLGVAVAEPQAVQNAVGFRITEAAQRKVSLGALAVWLRKGELDAHEVFTADYDEDTFTKALYRIKGMTSQLPMRVHTSDVGSLCRIGGSVLLGTGTP